MEMTNMFKSIAHISDIQNFVNDKKEIRFLNQSNNTVIGCYLFSTSDTFDSKESIECRGIAFDSSGKIISRPLHKFFNAGEKKDIQVDSLIQRQDIIGIYEKIDGSMIATAWINGQLKWRSKKSFESDVVKITYEFLNKPENKNIIEFSTEIAKNDMTAIFELVHPNARIVVNYSNPGLKLLHIRDNMTGKYLLLDNNHYVHELVKKYSIEKVKLFSDLSLLDALKSLENMQDQEGYVVQFKNGDMVKLKCPWYLRFHRCITFLRERDIALLCLKEELDDVKNSLIEIRIDISEVNKIENRIKNAIIEIIDEIEKVYQNGKNLDRKNFAIANKDHPLFGLIMGRYNGKEISITDWYIKNRLKDNFGLNILCNAVISEEIEV